MTVTFPFTVVIYLDANSSSRLRPVAIAAIESLLSDRSWRNASSVHAGGRASRKLLRRARQSVSTLVCRGEPEGAELVFTSGGTEACNFLIRGFLGDNVCSAHIVSTAIEHPAITENLKRLEGQGAVVTRVLPDSSGRISVASMLEAVSASTALVCCMLANNETGAIQPVVEIARALRERGYAGPIVSDMVQALGKCEIGANELFAAGVQAVAVSGHKIGAPAGIGAVVYSTRSESLCYQLVPVALGGPQENRLRAGTENVLGAVAFGAAADEIWRNGAESLQRLSALRSQLERELAARLPAVQRIGPTDPQAVINTLLVRVPGCRGDDLVVALDMLGVQCSTGAACASGKQSVSEGILALGLTREAAKEVLRISLDWDTSEADIMQAVDAIHQVVTRMQACSSEESIVGVQP